MGPGPIACRPVSKKAETQDHRPGNHQPEDLEAYEPPRIVPLGSFIELTSGSAATVAPDPNGFSDIN
jgi:hypothetical protein